MKKFRWSSLYPRVWREEFGDEFDAMLDMSGVTARQALDIVWNAMRHRSVDSVASLPYAGAWLLIALLNVVAREVQWPAGALLVTACVLTLWRRERWLRITLLLFSAIPISSLYYYQIPGIHHEPIYKTAVALIPTFAGTCIGLLMGIGSSPPRERLAP